MELNMLTRRHTIFLPLLAYLSNFLREANAEETVLVENAPNEFGNADFAGAWSVSGDTTALVAAVPVIPADLVKTYSNIELSSADDLLNIFKKAKGSTFNQWFNSNVAGKGVWKDKKISGPDAEENFSSYWAQNLTRRPASMMEFFAYMSVFINECGGNLHNASEAFGSKDHPGISYLFDKVEITDPATGRKWTKKSYNTGTDNESCLLLFNNSQYNASHGAKPLADKLKGTTDKLWSGQYYPQDTYPTSSSSSVSGYVIQADFFKFRGRGLIQTTWRSNYKQVLEAILKYDGPDPTLKRFQTKWLGKDLDNILTSSESSDWDELFGSEDRFVLSQAVLLHASNGKYLPLSKDPVVFNGTEKKSIQFMGNSIGGIGYGQKLKSRLRQMVITMAA